MTLIQLTTSSSRKIAARLLRMLLRDWRVVFALTVFVAIGCAALVSPFITDTMTATDTGRLLRGPGPGHLLGTDNLGRDIGARLVGGAVVTVQVVAIAVGAALVVGTVLGLLAGYLGGWVDAVVMRTVDGLIAFPLLVLALTIVAALGPGVNNALIAIAVVITPQFARLVRGEVLSLRTRDWVAAARIVGVPTPVLLYRHVLPHLAGTLLVFTALQASTAVVAEGALSFLGLGVQAPDPSWGAMVASGTNYLSSNWALSVFPGLALFLTIAAFNLLADALRDVFDTHRTN
ncbi:ABC transporter permease [Nesterenkonia ebinurensis]|uniref:ABC transporter permease n=1 Tax=Nesterenkonia ebinurensis TaxID=2608252 RepID=UPI00123DEB3A|nr:ABC transporter permease [Nesterenkonia ebinurensis]